MRQINTGSMDFVTFVPTGFFEGYQAWPNTLKRVKAPFPVMWGAAKA